MSIQVHRKMGAFVFVALMALQSQLLVPTGAAYRSSAQHSDSIVDLAPLPNFDIRSLHSHRLDRARVQRKKHELAGQTAMPDDLVLDWNEELDLPNRLLSLKAPLTAPSTEDPAAIARNFVRNNSTLFELAARQLDDARISARDTDIDSGFTRLVLEQRAKGIRVFDSEMLFIIDLDGRVRSASGSFIPELERRAPSRGPALAPEVALSRAALACGAVITSNLSVVRDTLPSRERVVFSSDDVDGRTEASIVYYPVTREDVRLAYQVLLYGVPTEIDSYLVLVDALSGEILRRDSLTCAAEPPSGRVFTGENPVTSVDRTLIALSGDTAASPLGWVTEKRTEGNNARVLFNPEGTTNGGELIQADPQGSFDFPLDLTRSPLDSFKASATNLFYWVNVAHDRFYALGFTETSRNLQVDNVGRGGIGGDPVRAETLRGASASARNNAYFSPSLDGSPPLMAMLMWTATIDGKPAELDCSYDAGVIIHEYTHGVSTRLTGTDTSIGLRSAQGGGMGEGWSDFFAVSFLDDGASSLDAPHTAGSYVTVQPTRGVRSHPYTTRFDLNPLTFGDVACYTEVHAQGTVWSTILWDMRQLFIERYGFETGRRTAERLVVDGLKATPIAPTFLQARDAILLADQTSNGAANQDLIWRAFARRGMGKSALVASPTGYAGFRLLATEAYDVPPEFSAGALVLDDKPPAPAAIGGGESLRLIVVDRDLMDSPSVDVRAINLATNQEAVFTLARETAGRFVGALRLLVPGQDGGPLPRLEAMPGDAISIKYQNLSNEAGTAETVEVRTIAARRVTLYLQDFEQGAADWGFPSNADGTPNWWHVGQWRGAEGSARSLCFAKEKPGKSFALRSSKGVANLPLMDFQSLLRPSIEFDYLFVGYTGTGGPPDALSATAVNIRDSSAQPPLSVIFDVRPSTRSLFDHATIDLRRIETWRAGISFSFLASAADVKRKKLEGFYLDNVRVTALSTR
ncbi:MAG TPA: M36 family metallopeptidase [Blastocatellia bacterium]|nr:M36 family metallopeptidase [Blastocatellia bacterium]